MPLVSLCSARHARSSRLRRLVSASVLSGSHMGPRSRGLETKPATPTERNRDSGPQHTQSGRERQQIDGRGCLTLYNFPLLSLLLFPLPFCSCAFGRLGSVSGRRVVVATPLRRVRRGRTTSHGTLKWTTTRARATSERDAARPTTIGTDTANDADPQGVRAHTHTPGESDHACTTFKAALATRPRRARSVAQL